MYLAVLGVMGKYNAVWTALTAIADMVTRLQGFVSDLQDASGIQGTPQTGIAGGKRRANVTMINLAAEIAGDLHAFAVKSGDAALAGKVDLHVSDLANDGDTVVGPHCQEIHDLANTHAADVLPFGTTAADITALQDAINAYTALLTKPREATVSRKVVTGNIGETQDSADALLKDELDRSMRKFKTKNAPFFNEYTNARMIIDLGGHAEKPPTPVPPAS
jgi:hypothetical protein